MNYSFSITTKKGDEYRIMLIDADISMLAKKVRDIILENNLDISEIMIDRISGGESTAQEVLHTITGKVADLFAINVNLILYYSCDDMTPIPSRNTNSDNKNLPVNEYRSRLFTHIFDTYMASHQISGITNTPIRLDNYVDGMGYSIFIHFIARTLHDDVIEKLKTEIKEVSGK